MTEMPLEALRDLLATDNVAGTRAVVAAIAGALDGPRAMLLFRVMPAADWDTRLAEGEQKRAHAVLRILLDGEQWSRQELSLRTRLGDRVVRDAIEDLRRAGFPILARSKAPGGYRLTDDPDEIEELIARELTPRADAMHEMVACMRRAAARCRASRDEGAMQPAQIPLLWEVA